MRKSIIILGFIIGLLCGGVVQAGEVYVTGGVGASFATGLAPDGTWHQDGLPADLDRSALGFKGGAGLTFGNFYLEGNYVKLGNVTNHASFVDDRYYDAINHHVTEPGHEYASSVWSSMQVGELVVGYGYQIGPVKPRVHVGAFGGTHRVDFNDLATGKLREHFYQGMIFGATGGGGLCVGHGISVCGDVNYYHVLASTKYPMVKDVVMPTLTVNLTLF